ncbi:MAG: L-2-amino-thiazoline-4-carboxylic acid hydrolase [Treponema sp.]|jgi:hypothetical protein|nr:L-2-amino-thiazoline-4-carboxylic acid hydrolase [Treponema sp.]
MAVKNEPKNKSWLMRQLRNLFEHRALWLYVLCDEASKKGFAPEAFAPDAIRRCGLFQGGAVAETAVKAENGNPSLKTLQKKLFGLPGRLIFEMKIRRVTDDNFDVDFHYCPLVSAWQKQGCSVEEMTRLCDFAMWGDRGIAESFGCVLDLQKTIAKGDGVCEIRFKRKE